MTEPAKKHFVLVERFMVKHSDEFETELEECIAEELLELENNHVKLISCSVFERNGDTIIVFVGEQL